MYSKALYILPLTHFPLTVKKMGATTSQYDTTATGAISRSNSRKTMDSPFNTSDIGGHRRLISDYHVDGRSNASRQEQQRILTLSEYQRLRATRSQSHTATTSTSTTSTSSTSTAEQLDRVTRNASAPCLSSRSSSSSSSSLSSSSRHLGPSPPQRTHRYTSPCVHPQFTCGNCNSTCNIVPYKSSSDTPMNNSSASGSSASSSSTYSSEGCSFDQNFCNRDCYYSYCFRLAEELDCTADDIIEANYSHQSLNAYMQDGSSSADNMISADDPEAYSSSYNHQQVQVRAPARCLQISRVH